MAGRGRSGIAFSIVAFTVPVVISITAAFLAWSQNAIMTHQAQLTRTFALNEQYGTGEMLRVRERINATIVAWINDKDPSMDADAVKSDMIETFGSSNYRHDFDRFVRFYDDLFMCVRHKGCSRDVAVEIFEYHAQTWWLILRSYIEHRRDEMQFHPAYGKGLECLVRGYPDGCLHAS